MHDDAENLRALQRFLRDHDASACTDDAEFTIMNTGQRSRGRQEIQGLLDYFYHGAFDARYEPKTVVVKDGHALAEGDFVGVHQGDFGDLPASGKQVRVPLAISYDMRDGEIRAARVYFEMDALRQQVH